MTARVGSNGDVQLVKIGVHALDVGVSSVPIDTAAQSEIGDGLSRHGLHLAAPPYFNSA